MVLVLVLVLVLTGLLLSDLTLGARGGRADEPEPPATDAPVPAAPGPALTSDDPASPVEGPAPSVVAPAPPVEAPALAEPPAIGPVETGIAGRVTIAPSRPGPVREGQPDAAPYPTTLLVLDAAGAEAARLTTAPDGRFAVALPPGTYTVVPATVPAASGRDPRAAPQTVTVTAGALTCVEIRFASGLR